MTKFSYPLFLKPSLKKLTSAFNAFVDHTNSFGSQHNWHETSPKGGQLITSLNDGTQVLLPGGDDEEFLTFDSTISPRLKWTTRPEIATQGAGYFRSGWTITPGFTAGGTYASLTIPSGTVYAMPVYIPRMVEFDSYGFGNISAVGTNVKMALFGRSSTGTGSPWIKLDEAEYTTALGAASTITVPFTTPQVLFSRWYWVAIMADANLDVYAYPDAAYPSIGVSGLTSSTSDVYDSYQGAETYASGYGALSITSGAWTSDGVGGPVLGLKAT